MRSSVDSEDSRSWLQKSLSIAICRQTRSRHAVGVTAAGGESQSDVDAADERRQEDDSEVED